jgi:signal transduction histidine kinase
VGQHRSWPVLLIGFGALIALILISGLGVWQRARETYREVSVLNERYRRTEQVLNEVVSSINLVGLLARDYLLDPSNISAPQYRSSLMAAHATMDTELRELNKLVRPADTPNLLRLREEFEAYWNSLDPVFEWTPKQKLALSWIFLRKQVLPRRDVVIKIAREIRRLTQTNLDRQRAEIDLKQAEIPRFIGRMAAITMFMGILIAGVSVLRLRSLEQRSEEQRLRAEAAERELRGLSRQLVQAQEEERRSISRELHDEVGQMLTALRMELGSIQELRTAAQEQFSQHLDDAKKLAEQALRAVRDMAMGLRPSMLDDLGLGSAVQWQARQFSKRMGVPVNVQLEGAIAGLPDRHRTCVYRLVQEALTNCARHARARTIDVAIRRRDGRLSVTVRDDGVGFEVSKVRGRGLGLLGIEERVREIGGHMRLTSQPRKGTVLAADIPVESEDGKI